ncbi:MAG: exodeoxyribonuclease III [Caldisericia bacterium]|nr:exodeoxyribonuclease III [Caldisericia bacterium]
MKIATWNINSIKLRINYLLSLIKNYQIEIICLQETKISDENFPIEIFKKENLFVSFSGEGGKNGVAIISREKPKFERIGFLDGEEDTERRLIAIKIDEKYFISTYVPLGGVKNSERFLYKLRFFDRLKKYFNRFHKNNEKIFLCGDFNVALEDIDVYDPQELENEIGFLKEEREKFKEFLSWGFYDSFRVLFPGKKEFSWWDYRWNSYEKNKGMRLDYILITKPIIKNLKNLYILKEYRELEKPSDHVPVIIEINE